jgi:uncharacterized protein YjiK
MFRTVRLWGLLGFVILSASAVHFLRLDARALLWLAESRSSAEERKASLWLPGYRAVLQTRVPGFEQEEFSDLAYNPASGTLFTVSGKQPLLIELSRAGKVLRSIPVLGASNLEGVAVLEDGDLYSDALGELALHLIPAGSFNPDWPSRGERRKCRWRRRARGR